jgi:hypothetical protein
MLKQRIAKHQFEKGIFLMSNEKVAATPKKISLVHGLYSKDVLLPWDDREEFAKLYDELNKEFFPSGASEVECVLDLALLHWRKRTMWRLHTATVARDPFTDEIVATGKKILVRNSRSFTREGAGRGQPRPKTGSFRRESGRESGAVGKKISKRFAV